MPALERVVGGENAPITVAPFAVSLQYLEQHICNGVLVTPTHILTAAGCVANLLQDNLSIRVGSSTQNDGGDLIPISNIMVHPNYSRPIRNDNDVAVLRLGQTITVSETVRPIAVAAPTNQLNANSSVLLAGWQLNVADNDDESVPSEELQLANLVTLSREECTTAHGNADVDGTAMPRVTDNMLCAINAQTRNNSACTVSILEYTHITYN